MCFKYRQYKGTVFYYIVALEIIARFSDMAPTSMIFRYFLFSAKPI